MRSFANTLDLYRGRDQLSDPHTAAAALVALDLWSAGVVLPAPSVELARMFRRAVRALIVADAGSPSLGSLGLQLSIGDAIISGTVTYPAITGDRDRLRAGLAQLALEIHVAGRDGRLNRLKACANPGCRWMFWDASRPGTGKWCSMQLCGGQHKSRAYRQRHP